MNPIRFSMSPLRVAAVSLLGFALSACGGEDASVGQRTLAATAVHNRVFGFEAPTQDWSTTNGSVISASSTFSQGSAALSVTPNGYTEIVSTTVAAPGAARQSATFDLQLPQAVGWGDARLVAQVPSQGHYWRDLGGVSLSGLAAGTFHTLTFQVPADVRQALNSAASDVSFRIILNAPGGSGAYLLDNLIVSDDEVSDPGGTPDTTEVSFSITVPQGSPVDGVMISATNKVTIDDRSTLAEAGRLSQVANLGTDRLEFGAQVDAYVDVLSASGVDFLRSQSHVYGSVTAGGTVSRQDGVTIDGGVTTGASILPTPTTWSVQWPNDVTRDVSRAPDTPAIDLEPGAWDSVQIFSRSGVVLQSGVYFINSLVLEPQAKLYVDASAGPVVVYVKDTLRLHVPVTYISGEPGQLLFAYQGSQAALFEEALVASVVAPNSAIELRRPSSGRAHEGSFFGKEVHVFSDATVRHLPLNWSFVCPLGDYDGDGIFDCYDECWRDPAKVDPGICGCGADETDTDGDDVPDCLDECPVDSALTTRSMCGCPSDSDVAPAGTPCNDGYQLGTFTCDGQGTCGDPLAIAIRPAPDCFLKTIGNRGYWICGGGGTSTGTGSGTSTGSATGSSTGTGTGSSTGTATGSGTGGGASAGQGGQAGAAALCAASPGGHLTQIDSKQENESVARLALGLSWIGAADFSTEGAWWWRGRDGAEKTQFWSGGPSGAPSGGRYTSWAGGAPEQDSGKNCGAIDQDGRWRARDCAEVRPYICEFPFASDYRPGTGYLFDPPKGPGDIIPGWFTTNLIASDYPRFTPPAVECVNPVADGGTLDEYRAEVQAAADRCNQFCGPDSDLSEEECNQHCEGPMSPPPSGNTCEPTRKLEQLDVLVPGTCQVLDLAALTGNEEAKLSQLRAAQDCSATRRVPNLDFDLDLHCGIKTICFALDEAGASQACTAGSQCASGRCDCIDGGACTGQQKYCVDPHVANACQVAPTSSGPSQGPSVTRVGADGNCAGQCFSRVGCGLTTEELELAITKHYIPDFYPPTEIARCSETQLLCGPEYADPLIEAELTEQKTFSDESFPAPSTETPAYSSDFDVQCAKPDCTSVCLGGDDYCGRIRRHPWCTNNVAGRTRDIFGSSDERAGGRGEPGSPVGFRMAPVSDLEFEIEPLPYGAANFKARAAAGVRATVDFDVLGTSGSVEIVDLRAEISASLCRASTAESRLEVVGVDFLPKIASKAIFDTDEVFDEVDGKKHSEVCEEAVDRYIDAFDRAKKALRDAQELLTQYNALKAEGRTFDAGFCEAIAAKGMRPPGMDGICPEPAEQLINRFVDYYELQVTQTIRDAIEGLSQAALSGVNLRDALNVGLPANEQLGSDNGYKQLFIDLGVAEEESVTLVSLQFFIGPIPCLLEVSSYVDYGIKGGFGLLLDPGVLIGGNGKFAQVGAEVGPFANSGITLFVGAGFNFGILELAVGVEGGVTLGHVSLPAVVSSGLSGTRERDRTSDRSLPNDLAALSSGTVLFPQPGGLGKYSYQFKYKYGVGLEVTDILSGYLDGTLKVTFLFFSKKFSQRLATFASPINIPPTMLIGGEGGTELGGEIGGGGYDGVVADGAAPWRTAHESVPFLSLNRLPAAPAGLVADASFDTAKVVGLFYDEVCEQCSPSGDTCERDADCCDKPGDVCVAGSGGQGVCGPPVCLNSLAPCTTADDCCGQNSCLRQLNGEFACSRQVRDSGNGATCYGDGLDAHLCANYCSVRTPTGSQQTPQAGVCETVVK